jgi:hypothetical protein
MSLNNDYDVKKSFFRPHLREMRLRRPISQTQVPWPSTREPNAINATPSAFFEDFFHEHSSAGSSQVPTGHLNDATAPVAPAASKSAPL